MRAKLRIPVPNAKQRQAMAAQEKYIAYGGARGGGKSWFVRVKAVCMALEYPGIKILIVRRTYPELENNHIRPLREQLLGVAKYNEQKHEFGPAYLSLESYFEMEKTSFMLLYSRTNSRPIQDEEIINFYNSNQDLFTRADGDKFELAEVVEIIKKRIREEEYLDNVKRISLQYEKQ